MIGQFIALALVNASVEPTAAPPAPAPATSAPVVTPLPSGSPTSMPVLGGVTLGDDAWRVLRRLGMHPPGWGTNGQATLQIRVFSSGCGDLTMALAFDTKIHAIMVHGSDDPKGQCADPGGVHVGDSVAHLISVRGTPDSSTTIPNGDQLRYGPSNGVHWVYEIRDTTVVEIDVSDGM
jgi:hypothetical protein